MLELNNEFFIQLINFLILLFLLNYILFKPLLSLFKERDSRINGFLQGSKVMDKERDELLGQIQEKLSKARGQAKDIFEELRTKGVQSQKQSLDSVKKDAEKMAEKARTDLEIVTKKTKEALKGDIEAFSKKIIEKMIKA
jgi:F-type H+-transporting ATPase subunit b